jgi:hypothetical protein
MPLLVIGEAYCFTYYGLEEAADSFKTKHKKLI